MYKPLLTAYRSKSTNHLIKVAYKFVKNYSKNVSKNDIYCFAYLLSNKVNRRVSMKQSLSLLLIISITVISWSSYAKNTVIRVNYSQPSIVISSVVLTPSLSRQHVNESFDFTSNKTTSNHNNFFELAIIFNEKLQQFIAFFTHFGDEAKEIASNDLLSAEVSIANISPSNHSQSSIQKCKANS